ncbi:S8 family serine peptidase [Bacillus safensis]|uniref:S8 family peptidase n=1 Tax=Bacillus safensis TaxID=561879 RepID=UPI002E2358DC|nr:S8 family serine peptidase [Bacillus safensis]
MKKVISRSSVLLFSTIFILSTFFTGQQAAAAPSNKKMELEKAEIFGEINVNSKKQTTVIVELKEKSLVEAEQEGESQTKASLKKSRTKVKNAALKEVDKASVRQEYEKVFSGFSMKLPANEIPKLLAVDGVKAVYPDVTYKTDEVKKESIQLPNEDVSPLMDKSAPFIGAPKAWDAGYSGKGVKVAVIDTGVDYTHPDLKGNFGLYKGYDFVDNDYSPQETPKGDPRGESTDHGTHVAGTIAANGQIKGVAKDATLLAYRVLGPGGSGTTENVLAGIDRAVTDGADVMNLSLGNSVNNPDYATSIALDWAMSEGVVAVTSNGNSGPNNWTVGSPGTSREAISVGATQLPYSLYNVKFPNYSTAKVMGYYQESDLKALDQKQVTLVQAGIGDEKAFEDIDVKGKVAVIERGAIAFVDKVDNAKAAGAIGVVMYNNTDGEIPVDVPGLALPTIKLSKAEGTALIKAIEAGNDTTAFSIQFVKELSEQVADFSSRGPVVDTWMIKPDLSAPGVSIVSTIPTHDPSQPYGYGSKQGTSMASPHVAGVAAIIKQAKPSYSTEQIKALLMNTAEKLFDANGSPFPHNTQGTGSVRIMESLQASSIVSDASYSYGTFLKEKGVQIKTKKFKVENLSKAPKTYTIDYKFNGSGISTNGTKKITVKGNSTGSFTSAVQVNYGKTKKGTYQGSITLRENGRKITEIPTLLIVKEPDYPRVTSVSVEPDNRAGSYVISSYLPGGAENLAFLVYSTDGEYLGEAGVYQHVDKGEHRVKWNGTINQGQKLEAGEYTMLAYATLKGKSDTVQTKEAFEIYPE